MPDPSPGDRISSYVLTEAIGRGSFGQVWLARHHVFGDDVAIKIPTDGQFVQNLRREGVTIHGVRHPNIVRAIDLDPYADPPFLVMEYVGGDSLRTIINAYPGGLPVEKARAVMQGVLSALSAAHGTGVIHLDIKPANILLNVRVAELKKITPQSVKVTDFGLGRAQGITLESVMQSGDMLAQDSGGVGGTVAYMSPEQMEGGDLDARTDLYSCGIVLFEMLTGERPQGSELPSQLRSDVPPVLDEVFKRCYARKERRYESAAAMLEALTSERRAQGVAPGPGQAACPSCHGIVQMNDNYCIYCGHQLVESVPRCRACGAFVEARDRFCILCGEDLTRVKAG